MSKNEPNMDSDDAAQAHALAMMAAQRIDALWIEMGASIAQCIRDCRDLVRDHSLDDLNLESFHPMLLSRVADALGYPTTGRTTAELIEDIQRRPRTRTKKGNTNMNLTSNMNREIRFYNDDEHAHALEEQVSILFLAVRLDLSQVIIKCVR